jgi:glycosyltransferase involved in cell wall biosynthesis
MTSLVVTSQRPHRPTGGYALRALQTINGLALLGPVDVVTVGVEDAPERVEPLREWQPFSLATRSKWDRVRTRAWPLRPAVFPDIDQYWSRPAAQWMRDQLKSQRYDVAVVEGLLMSSYLSDLTRNGCRVVFDAHNVEDNLHAAVVRARSGPHPSLTRRAKDCLLRRRMSLAEKAAVRTAHDVWACSDQDARDLENAYQPSRRVTVIPNGVDLDAYPPVVADGDWSHLPIVLFYSGSFAYSPNEDAAMRLATDVLPAVRARGYRARLLLVGRDPTPSMVSAARRDAGITVTGSVDKVLPHLQQPCVVTLPITLGSGTRLKILEAFACGRPVVSTAKGAEGIEAIDGTHLLVREHPDDMACAIVDLWRQPMWRKQLCANARELVRAGYSWPVAARKIRQSL